MRLTLHHIAAAAIAAAVVAPSVVSSPTVLAQPVDTTASVLKVVDGDTIDIRDDVRGRLRVRLLGIDAPETKKPNYTVGCWGPEATEFAEQPDGATRCAVTDPTQDRTTGMVARSPTWSGPTAGTIRSRLLVRGRRTRTSMPAIPSALRRDRVAEAEARGALRGLWGPPCFGDTQSVPL